MRFLPDMVQQLNFDTTGKRQADRLLQAEMFPRQVAPMLELLAESQFP